ncbi:hypothetical protein KFE25_005055 [Diacronema lutheri]|uniref:lactoylglutathione lyase n=1 Tax=Diacronema lutheri TaxID=2081491 RepID=A0A8J6C198_DIALT|nr:hypothetical protein KFE25_005055 [Diacronema lutheri]
MASIPDVSAFMTAAQPTETKGFIMQQTMVRVKDPIKSLDFYTRVLGMRLLVAKDFPEWRFSVYFVSPRHDPLPESAEARWQHCMTTPGCIELTWNHGSEEQPGRVYNTGNADATGSRDGEPVKGGFGHIGITCPDVYAACERFKALGVEFTKSPNAGGMKGLAFIKDPDGYLVEILPHAYDRATGAMPTQPVDCNGVALDGGEGYKDNSK